MLFISLLLFVLDRYLDFKVIYLEKKSFLSKDSFVLRERFNWVEV